MPLTGLRTYNFRGLVDQRLEFSARLTCISGANGCGKTSLLEAIYLLGRGRSFLTRNNRHLIRRGEACAQLDASTRHDDDSPFKHHLRIETDGIRAEEPNGPITRLSELADRLPLILVHPDSHRLISDGPQQRRRLLDWSVFHTEPQQRQAMSQYRHALEQRNRALRDGQAERLVRAWDTTLSETGNSLTEARRVCTARLEQHLIQHLQALLPATAQQTVLLQLRQGWEAGSSLADSLERSLEGDRSQHHTRQGPHRADLHLSIDGRSPEQVLSRGQRKLLVLALLLAQGSDLWQHRQQSGTLLIDDLPAELDAEHRQRLLQHLLEQPWQSFITAIDRSHLPADGPYTEHLYGSSGRFTKKI